MPRPGARRFRSLSRSTYGEDRRTDGAFNDDETLAFFNGEWVQCRSSNVKEMTWIEDDQTLFVTFLARGNQPEVTYQYFSVGERLALTMAEAPSKGGACWDYLIRQGVSYHRVG